MKTLLVSLALSLVPTDSSTGFRTAHIKYVHHSIVGTENWDVWIESNRFENDSTRITDRGKYSPTNNVKIVFTPSETIYIDLDQKFISKRPNESNKLDFNSMLFDWSGEKASHKGKAKCLKWNCEVWAAPNFEVSIYRGIILKMKKSFGSIHEDAVATSVSFDVTIPKEKFAIPADFKIKKSDR